MTITTIRRLERMCRRALYREVAPRWAGPRSTLRRAIRRVVRSVIGGASGGASQAMREKLAWMLHVVREARFAALVAGAVLAVGLTSSAGAAPIQLTDITAGAGGFAMDGEAALDSSGISVSTAGDVNGDGLADVIVGAHGATPNGAYSGRSYVVFGKTPGTLVQLSDINAGIGGFAINGEAVDDRSGLSVCAAGDVNGDGLDDLIIGAFFADSTGNASGRSYVVFGKASTTAVQLSDVTAGIGGFAIDGEAANDQSGVSVCSAGDVNADGLADLVIGAWIADPNGISSGRSYVVFGKATGTLVQLSDVTAGLGGFVIDGEAFNDASGYSVSGAGDVNGDGRADVIVGTLGGDPNGISSGRSYVVFGKGTGTTVQLSDVTAGVEGFAIDGEASGDESGHNVSAAGDVNGDGLADLIVGAWQADPNGSGSGRSYVVFGKSSGTLVQLSNITEGIGGFTINGEAADDGSGVVVSTAGDVNGDGLADLMVGAWTAGPNGEYSGRSYVVFGKSSGALVQLSDVAADFGGFAIDGEAAVDISGFRVSGSGDVNGDGLADLIVGARGADPNGLTSGRSYVVFSAQTAAVSATYIMKTLAGDGAGGMVAPMTDFGDVARVKIDFSDADLADNGSGGASTETVTIRRSNSGLLNILPLSDVANAVWEISSDRVGFTDAIVTLKYLDSEISGISGGETDLAIFTAPSIREQWTRLVTTVDAARNEVSATVTGFGFFAIGNASTIMTPIPQPLVSTDSIVQFLLGLQSDPTNLDRNQDTAIDVADVSFNQLFVEPKPSTTPSPANGADNVPIDMAFDWEDPDGRSDTFDFMLSINGVPATTTPGLTQSQLALPSDLDYATTYMWQITSNNVAASIEGPVWSFTTEDEPVPLPGAPASPSPTDGNTGIGVGAFLQWAAAADATSYDLFLWPSADPQPGMPTGADIMDTSFNPDLVGGTQYSWQVISKNATGQTAGPIWSFTTAPTP